jgi:hypothetical protein
VLRSRLAFAALDLLAYQRSAIEHTALEDLIERLH